MQTHIQKQTGDEGTISFITKLKLIHKNKSMNIKYHRPLISRPTWNNHFVRRHDSEDIDRLD